MNSATLVKTDDSWSIKIRLFNQSPGEVQFFSDGHSLEVLNTNFGFIRDDLLILPRGIRLVEVSLNHRPNIRKIECIINKSNGEQDIVTLNIPMVKSLSCSSPSIKVVNGDVIAQDVKIFYKPEWRLDLTILGDIQINVESAGEDTFIAFGDMSVVSGASDFVFPFSKYQNSVILPKEIVWIKHKEYKGHKLGCYELVKLNHRPNILYKVPISNKLDFADIPRKIPAQLGAFRYPTGGRFNPEHWLIGDSNLPVYKS